MGWTSTLAKQPTLPTEILKVLALPLLHFHATLKLHFGPLPFSNGWLVPLDILYYFLIIDFNRLLATTGYFISTYFYVYLFLKL